MGKGKKMKNKARYFAVMALCVCLGCGTLVGCGSKGSGSDTGANTTSTSGSATTTKESSSTSSKKGGSNQAVTAIEDSLKDSFTNIKDDGKGVITADLSGETTPASSIEITVGDNGQISKIQYNGKINSEESAEDNNSRIQDDFDSMFEGVKAISDDYIPLYFIHAEPALENDVQDYLNGTKTENPIFQSDANDFSEIVTCTDADVTASYEYHPSK